MTTDTPKTTRKRAAKKPPVDAPAIPMNADDDAIGNPNADSNESVTAQAHIDGNVAEVKPRRRSAKQKDSPSDVDAASDDAGNRIEAVAEDAPFEDANASNNGSQDVDAVGESEFDADIDDTEGADEDGGSDDYDSDASESDYDENDDSSDQDDDDDDELSDREHTADVESTPVELVEGGALYFVGVPIGNHDDITLRALNVLQSVDVVVCEEFKVGAALMRSYNLSKKLIAMNEHNEGDISDEVLQMAVSGKRVAVISDAGMPIVADPGSTLFDKARKSGVVMNVIPGVSSIIAALVASGFKSDEFDYIGFLSRKTEDRAEQAASLVDRTRTLVILESPYRLQSLLGALAEAMPKRMASIAMNLTMPSESVLRGTLAELYARFTEKKFKGEFVVVLDAYKPTGERARASERPAPRDRRESYDESDTRRPSQPRRPQTQAEIDLDDQRKWLNAEGQPIRPQRGSGPKTGRFGKPSAPRGGSSFPRREGAPSSRAPFKRPDSRDGFRRDDRRSGGATGSTGGGTRKPYGTDTRRKPFSATDSSKVYTPPNARRPYGTDDRRKPYSSDDRRKPYSQGEPRRSGPPRDPNRPYSPDSQRKPYAQGQGDTRRSHPQDNRRKSYPSNDSRGPRPTEDRRRPFGQSDAPKSYSSDDRRSTPRSGEDRGPRSDEPRRSFSRGPNSGPNSGPYKPKRPTGDRGPRTKK